MDGYITIGTSIDTSDFDAEIKYIENQMQEIEYKLKQADMGFEVGDVTKLESQYSRLSKQLVKLINKQKEMNKADFSIIQKNIDNVGNSISKNIKKIGKWALAIFGIRSAYMAVRQAMSTLSQYDEQLATNVEYIRYALANSLKPVIEYLVNLAYKLLTYVNYIAKAWFNVDLFANASPDGMKKANKQAKQLSKTLAGFDEMNVLSDASGTDTGGVGPSFDLTSPEDVPIPSWLQWILDHKDEVIAGLMGIAGALIAIKLGADLLTATGIGLIIGGIVLLIKDIIKFIKEPSWKNFANILRDLAIVLAGVALVMLAVNAANPVAWIILAIALVAALIAAIIKNWDKIKEILGVIWKWINEHVIQPIVNIFKGLWENMKKIFSPVIDFYKNIFTTVFENIKIIFNNIKQIFSACWDAIKSIFGAVGSFFYNTFGEAFNSTVRAFGPVINFFKETFNTIIGIFKTIGSVAGSVISSAFKAVVNGVLGAIENILNSPIRTINSLIGVINKIPGINLGRLNTFNLPRLAKGGIVSMPGRGVMVGGALAGEGGTTGSREGVIPLTDSQQMALLGEAIGRYITINANITNTMNGRVISRELQQIQNDSNFAFNR